MNQSRMFITALSFILAIACTPPATGGDTTRPTVTSVTSSGNSSVNVEFSEAMVGAATASNFSISPALDVTAAIVSSDGKSVTLSTASQTKNTKYTLGVSSSIKDAAGNVVDPTPATTFTGRGGTLTVTVTGLPAGVNPDVLVTEADTSSQAVTANSVVLDNVGSGTLSFAVKPVKPDAATFSDDSSPQTLNFVAGAGGSVTLKYACSAVKPPDANLDAELKVATGKQTYNCADLAKLTSLFASSKGISNINGIQYATGLTFLNLFGNQIKVLPANVFDKLTQLTSLGLQLNQIGALPANIFDKQTQLTSLILDNNQIEVLPVNIFEKSTQLTVLGLGGNKISVLPANAFDKLTKLTQLRLNVNRIGVLPEGIFEKLTPATSVNLNDNCLAALQEPLKTILGKVNGTVTTLRNPTAGCLQKTITIVSIETQKLTTAHGSFAGENIYLKTQIDGVAQADGDPIFSVVDPGKPITLNQSLFVNSELRIELFTQDIAGDIKIGEATVTVNNQYAPGLEIVPLLENGAVYVLKLDKK